MGFFDFVKNDFGKLAGKVSGKKVLKAAGIVGGLALMAINSQNDKNDRETMKNEITEELYKKLSSGNQG